MQNKKIIYDKLLIYENKSLLPSIFILKKMILLKFVIKVGIVNDDLLFLNTHDAQFILFSQ